MSDLKINIDLNGEGPGIESGPTLVDQFYAAKKRSRRRLDRQELTNAEFLRMLLDVWELHEARDVPDLDADPVDEPTLVPDGGRPRGVLAETQVYGFGLGQESINARLTMDWPDSESSVILRHELQLPDSKIGEWETRETLVVDPNDTQAPAKLEPGYREFRDRVIVEWHEDSPRAYIRHERNDGGWREHAAWEIHGLTGLTQTAGKIATDGGHSELIHMTQLPYRCRSCSNENVLYVSAIEIDGDYWVDAHNQRLFNTYCEPCGEDCVHVAAVGNLDAPRDGHPIDTLRDLREMQSDSESEMEIVPDGGSVQGDEDERGERSVGGVERLSEMLAEYRKRSITAILDTQEPNTEVARCQACGYTRERHPMEFPEAPTCETFVRSTTGGDR